MCFNCTNSWFVVIHSPIEPFKILKKDDENFPLKRYRLKPSISVPTKYQELIINMYGEKELEEAYYKPFPTLANHKFNRLLYITGVISG